VSAAVGLDRPGPSGGIPGRTARSSSVAGGALAAAALALSLSLSLALALALAVLAVPGPAAAQTLPTPASVLGFRPGDDYELATYEESIEYFQRLDEASDRITLRQVGVTTQGRPWFLALISSADNLRDVDRHRDIARRLADPGGLTDAEARALAAEGRAIVDISGGLHASEVAGAQHTIQLAYDLVSGADTDPRVRAVLDGVVLLLWPSLNPDGQTLIADWYRSNVGTPYETAPTPFLYQEYIGHDNNRDAYMLNMVESRVVARTWREWEPQIIYVHHQSSPFPTRIWLPPFAEPIAPRTPPLLSREVNAVGMLIAQMLESRGMPGAVHMGTGFDAWYPGYIDYLPMLQNQVAFWTETALHGYATPGFYTLSDFPASRRDLRTESLYSSPWEGGWWRLRDAVEYMEVASLATLDYAAKFREDLLFNRYQSGRDVMRKYREEGPVFAYFVPADQPDPVAPVELLRRLAFNGVRVRRLTRAVTHEGVEHPAGTWVIPMDQPYAELVRQLLEIQEYPDLREYPEGPPEQPYDAAGWTLPIQMGVRVVAAGSPLSPEAAAALEDVRGEAVAWDADVEDAAPFDSPPGVGFDTNPVAAGIVPRAGRVMGSGGALHVDPAQNNAFRAVNRAWDLGGEVRFDPADGRGARYVVSGLDEAAMGALVTDLALTADRGPARGVRLERPRIGLYRPWSPSMDEGWTRWLLERYGFAFEGVADAAVRSGNLRARFDVILLPSESSGFFEAGFAPGTVPPRYAGGMGGEGVRELEAFVREGGTLVAVNRSVDFVVNAFGLPVRNVAAGLARDEFFSSGSLLEARADVSHPLMAGSPERTRIFFDRSPVLDAEEGFGGRELLTYGEDGSPLVSGYLLGEEHLQGKAAALEVPLGEGRVILLGMRPQWRGQSFGTFRILFNAALYTKEMAEAVGPGAG
jgi:hypothetical protein